MPSTYEPIATTTLGSATGSITFSSISSSYTDLRLVLSCSGVANADSVILQFNSDTGTNYSYTWLLGPGSNPAVSGRASAQSYSRVTPDYGISTANTPFFVTSDIFSYSGSTKKALLSLGSIDLNGVNGNTVRTAGLWNSSSAIDTIKIFTSGSNNLNAGTIATLYGIKAA